MVNVGSNPASPTRKETMKRIAIGLLGLSLMFSAVSCGQADPPTPEQVKSEKQFFQMKRPDGTEMWCVMYATGTNGTQDSKSWFSFTCDWEGGYNPK